MQILLSNSVSLLSSKGWKINGIKFVLLSLFSLNVSLWLSQIKVFNHIGSSPPPPPPPLPPHTSVSLRLPAPSQRR